MRVPATPSRSTTTKASNLALRPVPVSLDAELKAYESYRLGEFSRFRTGAQVVI